MNNDRMTSNQDLVNFDSQERDKYIRVSAPGGVDSHESLEHFRTNTENTARASPVGVEKDDVASRYDGGIGPLLVYMGR